MKASKKGNVFPRGKRRTMRALFEILPVKNRNMIRCKLLASFYANKEGAASPKKTVIYIHLKALTDHLKGGSRVYSLDPYW
jgi:hypothetical protein